MEVASVIGYSTTIEPKMMRQVKVTSKMRHESNGVYNALHIASSENVSVLVINNGLSRDGYLAIPIEAFGITYTVVTLVGQPVFHVLSTADDTDVVIHFNDWSTLETISSEDFNLMYGKRVVNPGSTLTVTIKKRRVEP
ncbi:hypothetical protein Btru_044137 [Bulinus truncatus]|nr:hypothetical protein Btru_044137 [Bulinus truncatus]